MILAISMLKIIFPLHTKMHCIIYTISMCNSKYHNVDILSPKKPTLC